MMAIIMMAHHAENGLRAASHYRAAGVIVVRAGELTADDGGDPPGYGYSDSVAFAG